MQFVNIFNAFHNFNISALQPIIGYGSLNIGLTRISDL